MLHCLPRISITAALLLGHSLALPLVAQAQVPVHARAKQTLSVNGLVFKDLNANGRLDAYEDWRLPVAARVRDLASRMTLEEKAGMLLINTLNAETGGRISERGVKLIRACGLQRRPGRPAVRTPSRPASRGRRDDPRPAFASSPPSDYVSAWSGSS